MSKPDAFAYHEVVDRVSVISSTLDSALGEHPVVRRHPQLGLALDQAVDALMALYSEAARIAEEEHP